MARIIYSEEAIRDLERIIEFLLDTSPDSAVAAVKHVKTTISTLAEDLLLGRKRDALRRELVISRGRTGYAAMYRYDAPREAIFVLRIRHQREGGFAE